MVAYLDAHRVTAIAVYLRRPLTQLPALRPGETKVPPLPEYVLLTADLFAHLAAPWSLERVDKVVIHHMAYVLARHRATPGNGHDNGKAPGGIPPGDGPRSANGVHLALAARFLIP
jgi:hypothetical protein